MTHKAVILISLAGAAGIGIVAGQTALDRGRTGTPAAPAAARAAAPRPGPSPEPPPAPATPALAEADPASSDDIPSAFAALGLRADMPYVTAKARLAAGGYRPATPAGRDCASIGPAECAAFPEIEVCAGTGAGFCSALFAGPDGASHNVITLGPGGPLVRIFAAIPEQPREIPAGNPDEPRQID